MLKNYFVVALRNLYRNKLYTAVNLIGLGVAMALCVVGYVNYQFSQSFDSFHENKDSIYCVQSHRTQNGNYENWSIIPTPMAEAIAKDIPGVTRFSRASVVGGTVRYGDNVFREGIAYVDPDFFEMFTFPALCGASDEINEPNSAIVSDEVARKLFGDDDPVGRTVVVSVDGDTAFDFTVIGVVAEPALNSSMVLDVVLPFERVTDMMGWEVETWNDWVAATFIEVDDNAAIAGIEEHLQGYLAQTNEANSDFQMDGFHLLPLTELALNTRDLIASPMRSGMHPAAIIAPSITALLVLLLSCFNFVNTSIAFASRRLREIGIRKAMGGMRRQLITQFIGENLVLCLVALIVAAALAEVFVPAYDNLWPELSLTMTYSDNPGLVVFFVVLLLFTGVAAGAYPAFYVSRFNPVNILRGKQKLAGGNPLIRVLLTFQLALSMVAIIAAAILTRNADYIANLDHGYDRDNILNVRIENENEYDLLRVGLADHGAIVSVAATRHLMGRFYSATDVEIEGEDLRVNLFDVGNNYLENLGFTVVEGRTFDSNLVTEFDEAVIVNETLARRMNWSSALDKPIKFSAADSTYVRRVVGVVADFHPNGVESPVRPTVIRLTRPERYTYVSIKTDGDDIEAVAASVENTWKRLLPHRAYDGFWTEELMASEMRTNDSIRLVFLYIAVMVFVISGMGLFALVSLNIAKRTKEIGIRKVLGASLTHISNLFTKELVIIVAIGSVLASVLSYFLVKSLLSSIWEYYTDFGVEPFVLAAVMVLLLAVLTVGVQVYRVASTNPVNAIRDE